MELSTSIKLIERGITSTHPSAWADLGAGTGLFTRGLATLLPSGSTIYAVDSSKSALEKIKPIDGIELIRIHADFESRDLPLSDLDGILMANSLHFVKDKITFLKKASTWLKPDGCFVVVEYNTDKGNAWVPYPISFESARELFSSLRYRVQLIGEEKSVYNKAGMYAVVVNC